MFPTIDEAGQIRKGPDDTPRSPTSFAHHGLRHLRPECEGKKYRNP
jgi:hypothetical protein